jgi:hypothetical protein
MRTGPCFECPSPPPSHSLSPPPHPHPHHHTPTEDVPDAAPEIDIEVSGPADVTTALLHTTHLPPSADIYIQTQPPPSSNTTNTVCSPSQPTVASSPPPPTHTLSPHRGCTRCSPGDRHRGVRPSRRCSSAAAHHTPAPVSRHLHPDAAPRRLPALAAPECSGRPAPGVSAGCQAGAA